MPDSSPQRLHCDTGSPSPALFTSFVALQDVTENMGPTRFLLQTNRPAAHRQFSADKTSFLNKAASRIALLQEGDAVVYDSRVLHCGTENNSDKPRVLLVLTLRHVDDVSVDPATQRTQRAYSKTMVLSDLLKKKKPHMHCGGGKHLLPCDSPCVSPCYSWFLLHRLSPRVASLSPSRTSHAAPLQCPHVGHGANSGCNYA